MMILPRQARDKHRETHSKKSGVLCRTHTRVSLPFYALTRTCSGEYILETAETSATRVSFTKITKTVSRHAEVQISGRFRSDPAVSTFKWATRTGRPHCITIYWPEVQVTNLVLAWAVQVAPGRSAAASDNALVPCKV